MMSPNKLSENVVEDHDTHNDHEVLLDKIEENTITMRQIESMVERMLTPEGGEDVLGLGSAVIDNVAWHDFSAYQFLLKPCERRCPEPVIYPDDSIMDVADETENQGGDGAELLSFLDKLHKHASTGLLMGWEGQAYIHSTPGTRILAIRLFGPEDGDYVLQENWQFYVGNEYISTSPTRKFYLSSIMHHVFISLPRTVIADLMASYTSCFFPGISTLDVQTMYWTTIQSLFNDFFRNVDAEQTNDVLGTSWVDFGNAYYEASLGNLPSEDIRKRWIKIRDGITEEFPILDSETQGDAASELDRMTVQSLYHNMEQRTFAIEPYNFLVFSPGKYNLGLRLIYRQEWRPLGNQRGEVVRTIPLAPKQTEKVSVKVTRRLKYARTAENIRSTETARETVDTSKDSTDVANEVANTFNWNAEAEVSQSWIGGHASISGGIGGSQINNSKINSSFLSETTKKIATKTRTESKVTVNTESEAEFEVSSASELINPNEEIAVTYIYSKLQKQYEILTQLAEAQNVAMIAETVPSADEIDYDWVQKYDWIIAKVLLDDSFRDALGSISSNTLNPSQDLLGLSLLKLVGTSIDNLGKLVSNGDNLSVNRIDFSQEAQRGFREFNKEELERIKQNLLLEIGRQRLYQHIRDNILHYCRAIWSHEDPQQRLLRYRKEAAFVPTEWDFVQLDDTGAPINFWGIQELLDSIEDTGVPGYFSAGELQGEFRGLGGFVPFHELINPAGPIGFFGNYSIFYIRPEYANATVDSNLLSALRILQTPYTYEGEFLDPVLIQYKKDCSNNPPSDNDVKAVQREMVQFVPDLRLEFEIAKERNINPQNEEDSQALQHFWDDLTLFKTYYAEFLYRDEMSRRVVLDTNNLMMDIITGDGTTLEQFKLAHRGIDVLKALKEYEKLNLENQRRNALLGEDKYGDPDIERVVVVKGDTDAIGEIISGIEGTKTENNSGDS